MNILYLTLSAFIICAHGQKIPYLRTEYEWKELEFDFPSAQDRRKAEGTRNLIPTNAVLVDVQPHYNSTGQLRIFVTIPRFRDGIPYTLATISKIRGEKGPLLEPYPNYSIHDNNDGNNCNAIVSATHVVITECNQMWVLDNGSNPSGGRCSPQLFLFDLKTDKLIHHHRFHPSVHIPRASSLFNLVVNVRDPPPVGTCNDAMIYIADVKHHGLVVYDFKQNNAWRIENLHMYPEPSLGLQSVAKENIILMDGIYGLATDKFYLYFHPLASKTEYSVRLKVLDNSTLFENNPGNMVEAFQDLGTRKSPCTVSAMDSYKNLYCVTLHPIELIKWNSKKRYLKKTIKKIPIRPTEFQFISGMKVVENDRGIEELWMVSNNYQKTIAGTRNFEEINFRILVIPLLNNWD